MKIGDIVKFHATNYPNKLSLIDEGGTRFTWKQFDERVNKLANAFCSLGLTKGERVAIVAESCHEFTEFLFAAAKTGIVSVGLNYRATPQQILSMLRDCKAKAVLVQTKYSETIEPICSELEDVRTFISIGGRHGDFLDYESVLAEQPANEPEIQVGEEDLCSLLYTSGTTGEAKGVPLSHGRWIATAWREAFVFARYKLDDVVLLNMPFYSPSGQIVLFSACLAGATMVAHPFKPETFADLVEREKITVARLGMTQYQIVREFLDNCDRTYDFSSLNTLHVGSRPMPSGMLKEMLDFFNIPYHHTHRTYGMGEAIPNIIYLSGEEIACGLRPDATDKEKERGDSVGRPYLCELKIIDENGKEVPTGETGEVLFKGEYLDVGYWNNPELTRERFRDGWWHTRDAGFLDEDGYLYLKGRKDFMIKSGQLFVAPLEVEEAILKHPAVAEAAVIGVPDQKWGEAVTALVRLKKESHSTGDEIKAHCRDYLAGFQIPKVVQFVEALPKDAQGKIDIKQLKREYTSFCPS